MREQRMTLLDFAMNIVHKDTIAYQTIQERLFTQTEMGRETAHVSTGYLNSNENNHETR